MQKEEIAALFAVQGTVVNMREYGSGHINQTQLVEMAHNGRIATYILQRINTGIFQNVDELMENIVGVTGHLRKKIIARGGDPDREALRLIPTAEGNSYCRVDDGCYRMTRWSGQVIFMKARWRLGRFSHCWQIIRRIRCMRRFRIFIIHRNGLRLFSRLWRRTYAGGLRWRKRRLRLLWSGRRKCPC